MAVQAQYNVGHGPSAAARAAEELHDMTNSAMFLGEPGGGHLLAAAAQQQQVPTVGGSTAFSDLTCRNNNYSGCFVTRRVGDGLIMEGHGGDLLPQAFALAGEGPTSGRAMPTTAAAPVSHGLLSHLYRHSVEADALIRIENERLRAGLQEERRRHVRAAVSALEIAAARRLRDAEAELGRALRRNAELEQKVQQMAAEGQAWQGVARSHEAAVAGLRTTIDQILQSPSCAEGEAEAEDARSFCLVVEQADDATARGRACKACGDAEACVLLLPCRHLCLCAGCESAVDACPVCAAIKNTSLHVLLS